MIKRHFPKPILHGIVEHGEVFYVSGVAASDFDKGMREQAAQALERLEALLKQVGVDRTKVLSATVYITDMSLKPEMNESWVAFFGQDNLPARATIGVADLGPNVLLEIVSIVSR